MQYSILDWKSILGLGDSGKITITIVFEKIITIVIITIVRSHFKQIFLRVVGTSNRAATMNIIIMGDCHDNCCLHDKPQANHCCMLTAFQRRCLCQPTYIKIWLLSILSPSPNQYNNVFLYNKWNMHCYIHHWCYRLIMYKLSTDTRMLWTPR